MPFQAPQISYSRSSFSDQPRTIKRLNSYNSSPAIPISKKSLVPRMPSTVARMKAKESTRDLLNSGMHKVISLQSVEGELSPEVEEMASDFTQLANGEFCSGYTTVNISCKKATQSKPVKITTMKTLVENLMKSSKAFVRISRVRILYQPLFDGTVHNDGTIKFSLIDTTIEQEKSQEFSSIMVPLGQMSLSDLSMHFFKREKEMADIHFLYQASKVPVKEDKCFASMTVILYIHNDYVCPSYVKAHPTTLLIENLENPVDLNKKSGLSAIANHINSSINKNRKFIDNTIAEGISDEENRFRKLCIEDIPDEDNYSVMSENDAAREINESLYQEMADEGKRIREAAKHCKTYIDTKSKNHLLELRGFVNEEESVTLDGKIVSSEIDNLKMKIGVRNVNISKIYIGPGDDTCTISLCKICTMDTGRSSEIIDNRLIVRQNEEVIFSGTQVSPNCYFIRPGNFCSSGEINI